MMEAIADIEAAIVIGIRPHFLAISIDEEFIHVIVSHPSFTNKSISQRIRICYDLLREYNKELLKDNAIIIETYSPSQLNDLLEEIL